MFQTLEEYVSALRETPLPRYLATLERLRLSEIDGAAELSLLARGLPDRRLARRIGLQAADEARHGEVLARIIGRLEDRAPDFQQAEPLPSLGLTLLAEARRRFRPVLVRVWEGESIAEADLAAMLGYLYRAEERGVLAFHAHAHSAEDAEMAGWFEGIAADEEQHLVSVGQLLRSRAEGQATGL